MRARAAGAFAPEPSAPRWPQFPSPHPLRLPDARATSARTTASPQTVVRPAPTPRGTAGDARGGRSPGSRVDADSAGLPAARSLGIAPQWHGLAEGSPLTVAGAAAGLHRVPSDPFRGSPPQVKF